MIKSHYLQSAFKRCCLTLLLLSSLTSFNASSSDFTVDGLSYTFLSLEDLTCEVSGWDGTGDGKIVIPEMVTFKGRDISIIKIGEAFKGSDKLISITMPPSILEIAEGAFEDCWLKEVNLSENLKRIPSKAFKYCTFLKKITIPSRVKTINSCAFQYTGLEEVIFGESLESISYSAFEKACLQNVNFTSGIKTIGHLAFYGCPISNITIPPTIMNIQASAFKHFSTYVYDGPYIDSFKIEDSEQPICINGDYDSIIQARYLYIGRDFIDDSASDRRYSPLLIRDGGTVELGEQCSSLRVGGREVILNLENMCLLISHNCTPPIISSMPTSSYLNLEVRVPAEALEAYKQAPVWKNFWNIKAIEDESGISDIECDDDDSFQVYDTAGILVDASCTSEKLQQLPHGVYIVVKQDKRMKIKI